MLEDFLWSEVVWGGDVDVVKDHSPAVRAVSGQYEKTKVPLAQRSPLP